jgi:hypothetical protein
MWPLDVYFSTLSIIIQKLNLQILKIIIGCFP